MPHHDTSGFNLSDDSVIDDEFRDLPSYWREYEKASLVSLPSTSLLIPQVHLPHAAENESSPQNTNSDSEHASPMTVRTLDMAARKKLVKLEEDYNTPERISKAQEILANLKLLDPTFASKFQLDDVSKLDFTFRLLVQDTGDHTSFDDAALKSFIAISYACHNDSWSPVLDLHRTEQWPFSDVMLSAALSFRTDPTEGVWIDEFCIDQSNSKDRSENIAAMHAIYGNARYVVVLFEDVLLDEFEGELLNKILQLSSVSASQEAFANLLDHWSATTDEEGQTTCAHLPVNLVQKIMASRYWRRGWCVHETFLARQRHLLIPSTTFNAGSRLFIVSASELALIASQMANLVARMTNCDTCPRDLLGSEKYRMFVERSFALTTDVYSVHDGLMSSKNAISRRLIIMMRLDTSVFSDKITIALQAARMGLTTATTAFTQQESQRDIVLLSLAVGDASTICELSGLLPVQEFATGVSRSAYRSQPPIQSLFWGLIAESKCEYIRAKDERTLYINMAVIGEGTITLDQPTEEALNAAYDLLADWWRAFEATRHPYLSSIMTRDKLRYDIPMLLACVLDCGVSWAESVCELFFASFLRDEADDELRTIYDDIVSRQDISWIELENIPNQDWGMHHEPLLAKWTLLAVSAARYVTDDESFAIVRRTETGGGGGSTPPLGVITTASTKGDTLEPCLDWERNKFMIPIALEEPNFGNLRRLWSMLKEGTSQRIEWKSFLLAANDISKVLKEQVEAVEWVDVEILEGDIGVSCPVEESW